MSRFPDDASELGPRAQAWLRPLRIGLAASAFLMFGAGGALLGWLVLPWVWLCGGSVVERRLRCQRLVQHGFRAFHAYMRWLGLVDFDPRTTSLQPGWTHTAPAVLVANHPTLIDTPAVLACVGTACCVVAPWFGKRYFLRPLLLLCGHIVQENDGLAERVRVLELARQRLIEGHRLLIFPEGTRSPLTRLGVFQRGGFELAVRARVPLQPIAIRVEPRVLSGKRPWHELPAGRARYRLEALEPWAATDYPHEPGAATGIASEVKGRLERRLGIPAHLPVFQNDDGRAI